MHQRILAPSLSKSSQGRVVGMLSLPLEKGGGVPAVELRIFMPGEACVHVIVMGNRRGGARKRGRVDWRRFFFTRS